MFLLILFFKKMQKRMIERKGRDEEKSFWILNSCICWILKLFFFLIQEKRKRKINHTIINSTITHNSNNNNGYRPYSENLYILSIHNLYADTLNGPTNQPNEQKKKLKYGSCCHIIDVMPNFFCFRIFCFCFTRMIKVYNEKDFFFDRIQFDIVKIYIHIKAKLCLLLVSGVRFSLLFMSCQPISFPLCET